MAISIRSAFNNLKSERYNKVNIFLYIIMVIIGTFAYCCFPQKTQTSVYHFIYYIITLVSCGYLVVANNNAINKRDLITPNIFTDIVDILINTVKFYAGCLSNIIIFLLIPSIIPFIMLVMFRGNFVALIVAFLIFFALVIHNIIIYFGLSFRFYQNLEFKRWFAYKETYKFLSEYKNNIFTWFAKSALLGILSAFVCLIVIMIFSFIAGITLAMTNPDLAIRVGQLIGALSGGVIFSYVAILSVDLTKQLFETIEENKIEE